MPAPSETETGAFSAKVDSAYSNNEDDASTPKEAAQRRKSEDDSHMEDQILLSITAFNATSVTPSGLSASRKSTKNPDQSAVWKAERSEAANLIRRNGIYAEQPNANCFTLYTHGSNAHKLAVHNTSDAAKCDQMEEEIDRMYGLPPNDPESRVTMKAGIAKLEAKFDLDDY